MSHDGFEIDFPCPVCKQKFEVELQSLFPGEVVVCPICGAASSGGELSEINQALKLLERELILINLNKSLNARG